MPLQFRPRHAALAAAAAATLASSLAGAPAARAATTAPAAAASAPVSAAKKQLVATVLRLQQPGIEALARNIAQQPAVQLLQQAAPAVQRLPPERREAVARDLQADARQFVEAATPIVRDEATKLAPSTVGVVLEQSFTETDLRQLIAWLESPVYRKFQQHDPEMQRALLEKLVPAIRGELDTRLRALQQTALKRLAPPPAASAPASGAAK
ncbi:MAG: DUF2059 domain-containing protein [Burkholderiales bacterium]|nr:DUF2059 domain-containing protein [Burkholderiales bacterium]